MTLLQKISLFLLIVNSIILTACDSGSQNETANTDNGSDIIVTDFSNRTISLKQPARSIVSLAPHIVENTFSAGALSTLVGTVDYSNYPESAKTIEIIGNHEKFNFERIIELNPDVIIAWQSGNDHSSVKRLIELGFQVYFDQPDNLEDVAKSIRDIGMMTGNSDQANVVADDYLKAIKEKRDAYKTKAKITTFYQVWDQPLQTINGNHVISEVIELCGGINIYADEFAVAPIINLESIIERDPQAIIASGISDTRPAWLDNWKQWPSLQAVTNNHLFFVHPDHIQRHTVRLLQGIDRVCEQLDHVRSKQSN